MNIKIRHVKVLKDIDGGELAGSCDMPSRSKMIINISRKRNNTVNKYAATLLHELLHSWVNMLEPYGFNPTDEKEHEFVDAVEAIVVQRFHKTFKTGGK